MSNFIPARQEAAMQTLDQTTAAMIALAEAGIPADVQELLVRGDPDRGIAPGAITKALNTRPAAPVDGLESIRVEHRVHFDEDGKPTEWREGYGKGCYPQEPIVRVEVRELCDCSQAEAIIAAKDNEILALRRAIMNGNPDLVLRHESFIEMAATLHRACDGGRERAEKAEADNAALAARVKELELIRDSHSKDTLQALLEKQTLETQLAAAQKILEVYGPYTPTWLGPCVWAGIKEELPPQLVDKEVWISTTNPNEVKS